MKNIFLSVMVLGILSASAQAPKKAMVSVAAVSGTPQSEKFKQDREAILALQGCYKVTFNFAETFAPDTAYRFHDRHHSDGVECVLMIENSDKRIAFQHLLVVNDTTIVKHWREDWVYENTELYSYYKDNVWNKKTLTADAVKGQWTQQVHQVDDSPRYDASGTWVHVDGQHYWESTCDSPLPRREYTTRDDYNMLRRHSRIALIPNGWLLEQDNEKIIRKDGVDKLLVWEKGIEKFTTGTYDCQPALAYWEKHKAYWANVRTAWEQIYAKTPSVKLEKRVDSKLLWEQLFKMADDKNAADVSSITKTIESYLKA